jgi:hypothetical protein
MRTGQLYSVIAIMIIIPLLTFVLFSLQEYQLSSRQHIESLVADQQMQLYSNLERDFTRAVEIITKRAFLAAMNHVATTGIPLNNATAGIEELIFNGTLEGNVSVIMVGNTLIDWITKLEAIETRFAVSLHPYNLSIHNVDGFMYSAKINVIVNISDRLNTSFINRDVRKEVSFSVEGLEDPLYTLGTQGLTARNIKRYTFPHYADKIATGSGEGDCAGNVTFDPMDTDSSKILVTDNASGISGFAGIVAEAGDLPSVSCYLVGVTNAVNAVNDTVQQSGYYKVSIDNDTAAVWSLPLSDALHLYSHFATTNGPDYRTRLEGSLQSSSEGIETFVMQDAGIPSKPEQSRVAHLYFSNTTTTGYPVRGFPDWFRIDVSNTNKYNLDELLEN